MLNSYAKTFVEAKANLDNVWTSLASITAWDSFSSWASYVKEAKDIAGEANGLLSFLSPIAKPGASSGEVFDAVEMEAEGRGLVTALTENPDVKRFLGEFFLLDDTDLHSLTRTHGWGEFVSDLPLPPSFHQKLLDSQAGENLTLLRDLIESMLSCIKDIHQSLARLEGFGSYRWEEWQEHFRSEKGKDFPTEVRLRLETALNSRSEVLTWSKYLAMRQECKREGLGDFVEMLEAGKLPPGSLGAAFELVTYQSIGKAIYQGFPELWQFNGVAHDKARAEYQAIDKEIIQLTGKTFAYDIDRKKQVIEGQGGVRVGDLTEMQLLRRELNKQRRHIPIRQLIKRAGRSLLELKPCFMMGPLSVAQYLEQGAVQFDLVVMDEASQLRPEEAIGAIARGTQLVVVGDPKQLPPTNFFDRMLDSVDDEEEDEAPAAIHGMESILDICQQLFHPVRSLRWHYRSQHESLIAFSNHHFYDNKLILFPSPFARGSKLGLRYRHVKDGMYRDRRNIPEAMRVVDAVLEHMLKSSDESLGVVTLNMTQMELIEDLLDKKLRTFKEGQEFLSLWEQKGWPFFVKNLENVQGDERDVIFISSTFGKAPGTDKIRQNFGPISRPDGWRRLNVLFTRARRRVELFSSLSPEDVVVDSKTPLGTKALRDYLDFAKRGIISTAEEGEREPDSDFEIAVASVLRSAGYEVTPQLGVAGFFIDIAVRNPDRRGEFLAAIECDGATYHSGLSVRDRDRIRQEILESLGWKGRLWRIWSADWFYNPKRETEKLLYFLEKMKVSSALEELSECEEESVAEEPIFEAGPSEEASVEAELREAVVSSGYEDLFVEVGDRVTYCFSDKPEERQTVFIVDSASNAKMGISNEKTPVAQALLGLSAGEENEMEIPHQKSRTVRVLKIQRQ